LEPNLKGAKVYLDGSKKSFRKKLDLWVERPLDFGKKLPIKCQKFQGNPVSGGKVISYNESSCAGEKYGAQKCVTKRRVKDFRPM